MRPLLLILVLLLSVPAWGAEGLTVRVQVTASEQVQPEVSKILQEDLQGLRGVQLANENHQFELHLVVLEERNQLGDLLGYSVSHVFLETVKTAELEKKLDEEQVKELRELASGAYRLRTHGLASVGKDGLGNRINRVVVLFDEDILQPMREKQAEVKPVGVPES